MEQKNTPSRAARRQSAASRNRQNQGSWLSVLLIGCVVLFLVLSLVTPDRGFSDSENRKLAQAPAFSWSALADGSYFDDLGSYLADQFPGRDGWITMNLAMNRFFGQKEASGVYLCRDDYLMQAPGTPDEENLARNLAAVNAFAAAHPELTMTMSVVPNAVTVHADKLPANAPVRDQAADLQAISAALTGVEFVDVTKALTDHSSEYLFYRTDHHWTSLGAYYAFADLAEALDIDAPALTDYTIYPVSTTFQGTLSSRSGSHSARDQVDVYAANTDIDYYVTYVDSQKRVASMYDRSALEKKDHYTVFFGGNYARVDLTTTADTERNLLLLKDSYANCFVQFLYPYFDHIIMVDPRYYYDNPENLISSQAVTDVLYLYNADTFLSDSSLADVLGG